MTRINRNMMLLQQFLTAMRECEILCDVVCVTLRLAVSVEHRFVTDGRTARQLIPALASVARVKTAMNFA